MLITALPSFCPPPLKVSMSSVLSKQTQILKVSDYFFWQNDHATSYILPKNCFKELQFFRGGSVHIQNHQPSSYGSNREPYLLIPDLPRMIGQGSSASLQWIWWWEARRPKSSIPKIAAKKPRLMMYWPMTRKYKTYQFFALLVSYVNGIFSIVIDD